ncbi:hemin ABC transporter substrate-binding protein [Mesorhizobium microcysteis]|uniref:Hemin ABC transporter substrate-binding protein n=1 Tax=Neoaquamicrobium microcysteis TaxID=2682781 RepID=A0A5D4GZ41_9HYPH|nr:hemin ABC transporter substrate-binding protein [Mesorhizobium microcysteis]TYR32475.1 hemin ABC transporter substrate-binding protein [Mesorhizobium microcysteis]
MQIRLFLRAAAFGVAALVAFPFAGAMAQDGQYDSSRVVAIGGSVTEIIYALGEEARLIARDSTSTFPEQALELPDVGYMRALSPEGVLSVDPSLIIALEGSGPPEALEVLEKASVPMVTVPDRFDAEGILEKIRIVGDVLDVEDKAETLASQTDADLKAAQAATADITERKTVLFVLSLQGGRVLASGTNTAADGIIAIAGGLNAVTDYEGYKQLTDEAIIEAAPDVILAMDRGGDHETQVDELLRHPAIAATPAAQSKSVVRMDGAFLLGFGPRTAAAARELSSALYGDAVAD